MKDGITHDKLEDKNLTIKLLNILLILLIIATIVWAIIPGIIGPIGFIAK